MDYLKRRPNQELVPITNCSGCLMRHCAAQGDYAAAKRMLETLGVVRPPMQRAIDGLKSIPTDIDPVNER